MHILGQKIISISLGLSQKKKKLKSGYLELRFSVNQYKIAVPLFGAANAAPN